MRLQRLEISGFKSFPDRSELAFDSGVTAIVGPNGCGKSNVVDAIAWVLGEQSAKSLRGDRMEDVIFSGSDARKPTSTAEVRLFLAGVAASSPVTGAQAPLVASEEPLEDEEFDARTSVVRDVQLSRRLYRSGESEYLIDGESCRLRDVQDLLMDAGLGMKAYAVIEQGKIGQILSARPTDRRQLVEEAAGVTKYKTRRRAAELKLQAAQQNLTRIDDIVFEIEKQRGALKRQAAKARRFRHLREALRRWEKVLFASRYRLLAEAIEDANSRLAAVRAREAVAAAAVAEAENDLARLRIEVAEGDSRATAKREAAHACELAIGRWQQQIDFDERQMALIDTRSAELAAELQQLEARREPSRIEIEKRMEAVARAEQDRDTARAAVAAEDESYQAALRDIEGLDGDVEAARSEVFASLHAASALRHAVEHATGSRQRVAATLAKLEAEASDLRIEAERISRDRVQAEQALTLAERAFEEARCTLADHEMTLASARIDRECRAREAREREQELAGREARLHSLEELEAARAEYGDAARLVLAEANGDVRHMGSVADYLEVDRQHERAVEACFGDLLEHVVVPGHEAAAAGVEFVRERNAGRCGFLIVEGTEPVGAPDDQAAPGLIPLAAVVHVTGEPSHAIRQAIGRAWIAPSYEQAAAASARLGGPVATLDGDVFRGPRIVEGGGKDARRGILVTKREIKDLRERIESDRVTAQQLSAEVLLIDATVVRTEAIIASMVSDQHGREKDMLALQLRLARAIEEQQRIDRKLEVIATERRSADDEEQSLEARQLEAQASIARLEAEQKSADERFGAAQRRLLEARERLQNVSGLLGQARADHATLVERALALAAEVARMTDAARELDERISTHRDEGRRNAERRAGLQQDILDARSRLDAGVAELQGLREDVRGAEDHVSGLHGTLQQREGGLRETRRALDGVRAEAAQLEIERATAEADLSHLASSCLDTVQATLDEVAAEVDRLEVDGTHPPPGLGADDDEDASAILASEEGAVPIGPVAPPAGPEEAIADLRGKIDRLGPVNMMAIEQFDELESRHTFLARQRQDLIDSIAATGEAIRRIERTTRERFRAAFDAINVNFEKTFTTLFGGGRAGLVLIDESDLLESGIEIIAQPPGKRLQNVQLLSGGEKALTAMALMFAIFKYRPSPFCLLDEIDAPLDDANIGRFVEMLRGMQDETQFILITHNRKTMEIADRLYGVTMEEPGVSKLISVRLN
jgi:chromosome segregation protein